MGRQKLTTDEFIERSNMMHDFKYDYSKSKYIDASTKLTIICPNHGEFDQRPIGHYNGKGCEKCAYEAKNKAMSEMKIQKAAGEFIGKAMATHGNRFDYSKAEYKRHDVDVIIICSTHGEFLQPPSSHLNNDGCAECSYEQKSKAYMLSQDEVIARLNIIHDYKYDYSKLSYDGIIYKIEIICPKHGSFWQRAGHHLEGGGCPICAKSGASKSEIKWLNYIGIPEEHRQAHLIVQGRHYFADGFDPITNTVYEFYGDYWHGNLEVFEPNAMNKKKGKTFKQLYDATVARENLLEQAGFKIISIWEKSWRKITKA